LGLIAVRAQRPIKGAAHARVIFNNQYPHTDIVPDTRAS
jgi:hypothetical protein